MRAVFIFLFFYLFVIPTNAISDFQVDQKISYVITNTGEAKINQEVTLTNNFSEIYPKEYQITLLGTNIEDIVGSDSGGNIVEKTNKLNDNTLINVRFHNSSLGKGKQHKFYLNYRIPNLATKKGSTWEVPLPNFKNYDENDTMNISIQIPGSFGNLSYSSIPNAIINSAGINNLITINETDIKNKKILFIFGDYQLFDLNLKYYLNNDTSQTVTKEIPLPPDTNNQKIIYEKLNPLPQNVRVDKDGNWLAQYTIKSKEEINIELIGQAKIYSKDNTKSNINFKDYLTNQNYWPVSDVSIQQIAANLKSPRDVYNFTQSTLDYNYEGINSSAYRKGALEALLDPSKSLCTEFTDVFVTLSRAINIPAREIEGFAYSNNPKIKPTITTGDILHAWPQYYDVENSQWVSIDPTWGKTTNGIDFFNDLDLNHIAFVIHGISSEIPLPPGSYKKNSSDKSIDVNFATIPLVENNLPVHISYQNNSNFFFVNNPNGHAIYDIVISSPGTKFTKVIEYLPPFSKQSVDLPKINIFQSLLPGNKDIKIIAQHSKNNEKNIKKIPYLPHYKNISILIAIITISTLTTVLYILLKKNK